MDTSSSNTSQSHYSHHLLSKAGSKVVDVVMFWSPAKVPQPSTMVERFQKAFDRGNLASRCKDLIQLFNELSLKELQHYYPLLLEHIFGFGQIGWGLKTLERSYTSTDFETVRSFLSPDGPLFTLIYQLLGESSPKYDFPINCLPESTQKSLKDGIISPLFANKFQYQNLGMLPASLHLNAFDFYIFHFAYHIVNPAFNKATNEISSPSDSLYSYLFEDYLHYFLPSDGSSLPPAPYSQHSFSVSSNFTQTSGYSPFASGHHPSSCSHPMSPGGISPSCHHHHCLLKQGIGFNQSQSSMFSAPAAGADMGESWRSETFVAVVVEFWLNPYTRSLSNPVYIYRNGEHQMIYESYIPSQDHMSAVRILVKYLHYFVSSLRDLNSTNIYQYSRQNSLEEFKRTVIPQLVRRKLYHFLKQVLSCWPLDASFRLPLETWLSFIQPWRYTIDPRNYPGHEGSDRSVDLRPWEKFVRENLLFYSALFQQLLPRFFWMDLSCPKNAFMLNRVVKVFSQSHLCSLIAHVEMTMQNSNTMHSPIIKVSDPAVATAARQNMFELEHQGFAYEPMFGEATRSKITELVKLVMQAKWKIADERKQHGPESRGWKSWLPSLLSTGQEDQELQLLKKAEQHLDVVCDSLCHMFKVQPPITVPAAPSTPPREMSAASSFYERQYSPSPKKTSPFKAMSISYLGNPDTQPIRSFEIAFLVRILHSICTFLNERYSVELQSLYYRPNFVGSLMRELLMPPTTYTQVTKMGTVATSPRVQRQLPPRISLRFLASHQTLGYLAGAVLMGYIWSYKPSTTLLLVALFYLFFILLRAFISRNVAGRLQQPGVHEHVQ